MKRENLPPNGKHPVKLLIASEYSARHQAVFHQGDCVEFMRGMPDEAAQLVVTSPPYNLGKKYEKRENLEAYLAWQGEVIDECVRVLSGQTPVNGI